MEWGHRRTRQLLRKLRTPGEIHRDELALALQRITGAPTPRDAVLGIIERALRAYPAIYFAVVRRADIEGESTQAIAEEVHLSDRSFFRYRSAAISAISAEIESVTRSAQPPSAPREQPDAMLLYARGRYLWRHRTGASLRRAMQYFDRAIDADPRFARAYAGIADVHLLMGEYIMRDPADAFADAHAALSQALALDATLPEVHATLADLAFFEQRDPRRARASYDIALAIDPNYTTAHQFAAWLCMFEGDFAGAVAHLHKGLARDPHSLELHASLGKAYNKQGRPDLAVGHLTDVIDLDPTFSFARFELARVLITTERYAEARDHLALLAADEPRPTYRAAAALAEARLGNTQPAHALLRADELDARRQPHYFRALAHIGLGTYDDALRELKASARAGEPWAIGLRADVLMRPLHADPEFHTIVAAAAAPLPLRTAG